MFIKSLEKTRNLSSTTDTLSFQTVAVARKEEELRNNEAVQTNSLLDTAVYYCKQPTTKLSRLEARRLFQSVTTNSHSSQRYRIQEDPPNARGIQKMYMQKYRFHSVYLPQKKTIYDVLGLGISPPHVP